MRKVLLTGNRLNMTKYDGGKSEILVSCVDFWIVYAPCDVGSNENGIEIATGKAGQNIK